MRPPFFVIERHSHGGFPIVPSFTEFFFRSDFADWDCGVSVGRLVCLFVLTRFFVDFCCVVFLFCCEATE